MRELLLVSGNDYRTPRRVNVHFIAEAATGMFDRVSFFSIGFSPASLFREDRRKSLWREANRWVHHKGVDCFLWKTPLHPFNSKNPLLRRLMEVGLAAYERLPCKPLDERAGSADVIAMEAGLSPLFIKRLRRAAPNARFVYIASDLLATIGVHPRVQQYLEEGWDEFDLIQVPARAMLPAFAPAKARTAFIPHGFDKPVYDRPMQNPYDGGQNVVSVGSMLFDDSFFRIAAEAHPDVRFHVIGSGAKTPFDFPPNVTQYPEMVFEDTLPYIKYADVGVAPYRDSSDAAYIADSSMKLRQYSHFGLPAVCPDFAVADYPMRFGYRPGDPASISRAVSNALRQTGPVPAGETPSWEEVTRMMFLDDN